MSIEIKELAYTYMRGTPFERKALEGVSLDIPKGSYVALAGHTGSGKSTLIQHMNGLLSPYKGSVVVDGTDINKKSDAARKMRRKVGMVFQYPENQLFEETVASDIAFGPLNLGLDEAAATKRVKKAMELVQLDYDKYKERSPFQLSGGQKRRAAIAGVLAMQPDYLVLDEPAAGLDPQGKEDMMQMVKSLHKGGTTIVLVSHDMDDIARFADKLVVMDGGRIIFDGKPMELFSDREKTEHAGLRLPKLTSLLLSVREAGFDVDVTMTDMDKAVEMIAGMIRERKCRNAK